MIFLSLISRFEQSNFLRWSFCFSLFHFLHNAHSVFYSPNHFPKHEYIMGVWMELSTIFFRFFEKTYPQLIRHRQVAPIFTAEPERVKNFLKFAKIFFDSASPQTPTNRLQHPERAAPAKLANKNDTRADARDSAKRRFPSHPLPYYYNTANRPCQEKTFAGFMRS